MWKPGCSFEMQRLRHREGKGLSEEDTGIRGKSKSEPRCPDHQGESFFPPLCEAFSSVNGNAFHPWGCILPRAFPLLALRCTFLLTSQNPSGASHSARSPPQPPASRDWSPPHLCSSVILCSLPSRPRETRQDVVIHLAPFPPNAAS